MTGEQVTPEELAATLEQTATWMATRPAGVTWAGDGLDGTVAGLRDAAKGIRKQLAPAWDALTAENARLARIVDNDGMELNRIIAATEEFGDPGALANDVERMARSALAFGEARDDAIRERDAGRQADVRPDADEPGWLHVTCGGCGVEFGTNFAVEELECPECEARRCPACHTWFGGES
jgi:hypothetical protein